jgi:integrase
MKSKITDATLKRKYREGGDNQVYDELLPGFVLRIGKRQSTFTVITRIKGQSNQIRIKVGTTSTHKLTEAREAAREILRNATNGIDPSEVDRKALKEAKRTAGRTFRAVADEFMYKRAFLRSVDELQRKLDKDILPAIGHMQMADIDKADLRKLIRDKAKASPVAANRVLSLLRSIYRFAAKEDYVDANLADAIDYEPECPRDRHLTHVEIKTLWRTLDGDGIDLDPSTRACLKFLLATGQRRGEAATARWEEFDFERDLWSIPAERTKNGLPHIVPLSPLALDILEEMAEWATGDYVFPGQFGHGHLSPYSVSQGMKKIQPALDLPGGIAKPHDLRRTFVTQLNETLAIDPHVIEAAVNHVSGAAKAGVAGVYNRALYIEQRKAAMQAWGDLLAGIVTGRKSAGNVVEVRRAGK